MKTYAIHIPVIDTRNVYCLLHALHMQNVGARYDKEKNQIVMLQGGYELDDDGNVIKDYNEEK